MTNTQITVGSENHQDVDLQEILDGIEKLTRPGGKTSLSTCLEALENVERTTHDASHELDAILDGASMIAQAIGGQRAQSLVRLLATARNMLNILREDVNQEVEEAGAWTVIARQTVASASRAEH